MNKIMEYMAFGKPVVAFDLSENRYSAREAALYASPNDVEEMTNLVLKLLENQAMRKQMGEFGFERARKYLNWENSIPNLTAAYVKVAGKQQVPTTVPEATHSISQQH